MSKIRVRVAVSALREVEALAEANGITSTSALDAVIKAGLQEIKLAKRYELLPTGMLVVRDEGQNTKPANRRNQRASTVRSKPQSQGAGQS